LVGESRRTDPQRPRARHSIEFDYTASLTESPEVRIEERRHFVQGLFFWTTGVVWSF
jgi:hypothetical protein